MSGYLTGLARTKGISQTQYDRIFAPLAGIDNYEQAASDLANFLAAEIFGLPANAREYYIRDLNPPPSLNSVNIGALPNRPVTDEDRHQFNRALQQAIAKTADSRFNDQAALGATMEQVFNRAVEAGLLTPNSARQQLDHYKRRVREEIRTYETQRRIGLVDSGFGVRSENITDTEDTSIGYRVFASAHSRLSWAPSRTAGRGLRRFRLCGAWGGPRGHAKVGVRAR